jgi:hypothetical protein
MHNWDFRSISIQAVTTVIRRIGSLLTLPSPAISWALAAVVSVVAACNP